MKKYKRQRGITLIALVITIIVLLILAGVSVATLTGDNGILSQADRAKTETEKKQIKERVEVEVLRCFGKNGELDYDKLKNKLNDIDGISSELPEIADFPLIVTINGVELKITENGDVTIQEPFDAEEWDKTAAEVDCFIWASNTEGEDGYGTVIGYTSKINSYTKLRFPTRCTKIEFSNDINYDGIDLAKSRGFTNNIAKVEIPSTVTSIGSGALSGGSPYISFAKLEEVEILEGLTTISSGAFSGCTSLKTIALPDSVTTIGSEAFFGCTNLSNFSMSKNVTTIGAEAFSECTSLKNIVIWENTNILGRTFDGWGENQTINIQAGQIPSGWATNWNNRM